MRIAHLITRLIIGGAQENTLFSVEDQHHLHGDQVCLITGPATGPEGTLVDRAGMRQLDVRILPQLHRNLNPLNDTKAYFAVKQQLRDYQPDLVHTHSSKAGILGRRAAHTLRIPCVHTIHGASFHYGQPRVLHWAYRRAEKFAERWCQHFITVCDAMTQQYLDAGIGTRSKYTTIYSGMDVNRFLNPSESTKAVRTRLGIANNDIVVVKVARLFNLKGHDYLIDAATQVTAAIPNVKFLLVGDGILRNQFESRIAALGLSDHFVYTGLVPPADVTNYIHAADLVAHTSVWEGLARVLPQGLIAGKPIVSFDIDGAPEVCIHDETGLLVPTRNVKLLADAIIRLASDEQLRKRLGEEGRRRFTEQFRHEFMTERIREVYRTVLTQR
ncbi:MAG: glycosyltransferase family 4 protein [Fuerstiella sp.]|nr:glycosyltransferase family 4 protein [Fuerstiella sp.]